MKRAYILYLIIITFITTGCVEPFDFETISFENALVIEATITNEFKYQEINLSRTFKFEDDLPLVESNAEVKIIDDSQIVYTFEENEPGKYKSVSKFSAQPDNIYILSIITSNGKSYSSRATQLTNTTQIDEVTALRETNPNGIDGISILVDSFDPSGNSRYYRYEYEETYKIIAPYWSQFNSSIVSDVFPFEVGNKLRDQEEKICFNTLYSKGIIQTETNNSSLDRVTHKLVRFISSDDFIITNRYSILVKQYVQSLEAFTYYKILNELSGNESLLSQNQPGFFNGNIFSNDDPDEKVLGFFDVSSISTKRVFFNYRDLIPFGFAPSYIIDCELFAPLLIGNSTNTSPLIEVIRTGSLRFYQTNDLDFMPQIPEGGPHIMVIPECGDCTTLGSNKVPDFWVE